MTKITVCLIGYAFFSKGREDLFCFVCQSVCWFFVCTRSIGMSRTVLKGLGANFQSLPRLPVPTVGATLNRYRESVSHLKKKDLVEKHLRVVDAFESSVAHALNIEVLEADKKAASDGSYPFSYIEKIWDDSYLGCRDPSPVNISAAFSLKGQHFSSQQEAAAKIAFAVAAWIRRATTEGVESEGVDLSQLQYQFCCSRVPGLERDTFTRAETFESNTITVLRDGHVYLVRTASDEGVLFDESSLEAAFAHILSSTISDDHPAPVSVLTSGKRSDWAASYTELMRHPENESVLKSIQHSAIVVCLDSQPWTTDVEVQKAMLCGGPEECENRWYDKHQVIISKSGQVAFNFEHAFSDGMTWCKWIKEILAPVVAKSTTVVPPDMVRPLSFTFGKSFASRIRSAKTDVKSLIDSVELASATLPIGKKALKKAKFSPDSFAQMVFHAAFFSIRGKIAPTYESCSTNKFFHGRTETMRTATADMHKLLQALESDSSDLRSLMTKVQASHIQIAKLAAAGEGCDRHLLALKKRAEARGGDAMNMFNDELFTYSNTWLMSTSNLSLPFLEFFNFGPVSLDGFGIGYIIDDECMRVCISSRKDSPVADAEELKSAMFVACERLSKSLI